MGIIAVDLAAKYSAAVLLTGQGRVEAQFDSVEVDEDDFLINVVSAYTFSFADQLIVEDLPHGVGYRGLVKRVCQIQGRLADKMARRGQLGQLLFVAPETWRRHYPPLRKRGAGQDAVLPIAAELGYTPPDLSHLHGPRGGTALADKVRTDYADAYLIGRWAIDIWHIHGSYDVPGTARYGQPTIRRTRDAQNPDAVQ